MGGSCGASTLQENSPTRGNPVANRHSLPSAGVSHESDQTVTTPLCLSIQLCRTGLAIALIIHGSNAQLPPEKVLSWQKEPGHIVIS